MSKKTFKLSLLASVLGSSLIATSSQAADFYFGENDSIVLQINSQLSAGASWRLKEADPRFIAALNNGAGPTSTTDDGNLNFEEGETFSKIIKGVHDIQLSTDNFGVFTRVKYWYDKELKDENRAHGNSINGYAKNQPLSDEGFADFTKFSGIELLDAYFYTNFDMGDIPVDFRLGRQVVSWGESTFIQGGLNSTNPFDISALRRPGAELKEGLLPVGMAYANFGLTDNLSLEAFYQYEWEKTLIDGCGTLFSTTDFAATGCNAVTVSVADEIAMAGGFYAQRQADIEPDDGGQFGLAMRYFSPELNDTEFGIYYMNIHSRMPLTSANRTMLPLAAGSDAPIFVPSSMDPTGGVLSSLNPTYMIEFPEDLKFYGLSFATNAGGLALSGEISYKPDTPVQISGPEVLNAVFSENLLFRLTPRLLGVGYGEKVQGWDEFDVTQIQMTAMQFFDRVMGATRLTLVAEAGLILTDGVEDSNQKYGRNSVFGLGDLDHLEGINCAGLVAAGTISGDCSSEGFVTDSAWGYRMAAVWDYSDVFAGVSLKPTLSWSHDVSGNSPDPGTTFNEGRKSLGLSVEASYQQKYSATLGYKTFSGGSHNVLEDKDFVSLSFAISY